MNGSFKMVTVTARKSSLFSATPLEPLSDLKLLRKFTVWKLFNIILEVTSEVFGKKMVYDISSK